MTTTQTKIKVIGAGFSGLSIAYELSKLGFNVEIFEKNSKVGGLISTRQSTLGNIETAASSIMMSDSVENLVKDLGLNFIKPSNESKKRFIFRDKPRRWPLNFIESTILTLRLFYHAVLLRKSKLKPVRLESIEAWGFRTIGRTATEYLLKPALQGIYAGESKVLSASLILSPLFKKKRGKYNGTICFQGGMQSLINSLESKLKERGVLIHLNCKLDFIKSNELIVIATSPHDAADILSLIDTPLSEKLRLINMSSIVSVTTFFNSKPPTRYQGFGCLFPKCENFRLLGVLMNSVHSTVNSNISSETYILGGSTDLNVLNLSGEEIKSIICNERDKAFGLPQKFSNSSLLDFCITRWPKGLTQYDLTLEQLLADLKATSKNIFLHGNYLGGIGLSKILERSKSLAEEISSHYLKPAKKGILLVNTGSPNSPEIRDVKLYLKKFLMNRDVITMPWLLRYILVNFIIIPSRVKTSSQNYKKIWTDQGSPLVVYSSQFKSKLEKILGQNLFIQIAMSYGQPCLSDSYQSLINENVDFIHVVPMYPQFAHATSGSVEGKIKKIHSKYISKNKVSLSIGTPFFDKDFYVNNIAKIAMKSLKSKRIDHYLFSFHGLPTSHLKRDSQYKAQCLKTAELIANQMSLSRDLWSVSYQSRLSQRWIGPATEAVLKELPKKGIYNLAVLCPSFVADCIETIDEIGLHGRKLFLEAGGQEYFLVDCLNAEDAWVSDFAKMYLV